MLHLYESDDDRRYGGGINSLTYNMPPLSHTAVWACERVHKASKKEATRVWRGSKTKEGTLASSAQNITRRIADKTLFGWCLSFSRREEDLQTYASLPKVEGKVVDIDIDVFEQKLDGVLRRHLVDEIATWSIIKREGYKSFSACKEITLYGGGTRAELNRRPCIAGGRGEQGMGGKKPSSV